MTPEEKGFRRTLRLQGRSLVTVPEAGVGQSFLGTINRIGAYAMTTSLSDDPRGKRFLEMRKDSGIVLSRKSKIRDVNNDEVFKVTAVGLDCPDYALKYELIQVTDKDQ